jgi:hypothetical protein
MSEMQPPPRRPKGHRPQVFDEPAIDQLHAAFVALATELSVAFDRIDTLERLLEQRVGVARDEIERFQPDEHASADRAARRADVAERMLRPFRDFREDQIARATHSEQRSADAPPRRA